MTDYDPVRHRRRSIRLARHDYAGGGAYFLTICTFNRECLFGDVVDGRVVMNPAGRIVAEGWVKTAAMRSGVRLDEWVVMPNHIHGIVIIVGAAPTERMGGRPVAATSTHPGTVRRGDRQVAPATRPIVRMAPDGPAGPPPKSIGALVAGFKSAATTRINQLRGTPGAPVWQRNYYEHVIRDEEALRRIRAYIAGNPARWWREATDKA